MTRTLTFTTFCLSIGLAASVHATGETDRSTRQLTMKFSGSGDHTLEVRAINGSISVEAYDGSDVMMTVAESITAESQDALQIAKRDVVLDTADNTSVIHAIVRAPHQGVCGDTHGNTENPTHSGYSVRFDFTIRVPRSVRLQLCTINEGNVLVSGTSGDFDISSINGRITMNGVSGSGNATTINGPVTASFTSAPKRSSKFKTINGTVALSLPDDLSAELHMKTFNGHLLTDFPTAPELVPASVAKDIRGGMTVLRSGGFTSVRVGNGGPDLTLESLNGDVRVVRTSK
jgi:hypothetical protein